MINNHLNNDSEEIKPGNAFKQKFIKMQSKKTIMLKSGEVPRRKIHI